MPLQLHIQQNKKNGYRIFPVNRFRRRTDEEIIRLIILYAKLLPNNRKVIKI